MMPKYSVGDKVWLRESAARGFLEPVIIQVVTQNSQGSWIYTVIFKAKMPINPAIYGDRVLLNNSNAINYAESEFVSYLEACLLVEQYLKTELLKVQQIISKISGTL